jgi:hypothetical protein
MKNPAAILSAVAGLLLTSLCCLAGIGAALYSTFLVPRAAPPPGFASAQPSTAAPGSTPSLGTTGGGGSAAPSLLLGQAQSNYGSASVSPGVDVGPMAIVSGVTRTSSVAFDGLGITPMDTGLCRGYGTAQPDIIVNVTAAVPALNFVVQANDGGDTTLLIHHAGRYWCSDDEGGALNPLVNMTNVEPGQYDVWVGSYSATQNVSVTFTTTQN